VIFKTQDGGRLPTLKSKKNNVSKTVGLILPEFGVLVAIKSTENGSKPANIQGGPKNLAQFVYTP